MGLKSNFKQAAKELIDGRDNSHAQGYGRPSEAPPVYYQEPETTQGTASSDFAAPTPEPPKEFSTIIASGTVIRGTIDSQCNVEVYGELQGDVTTAKDLKLQGSIQGNAAGGNVEISDLQMVGNISASGVATIDAGSAIEGDVAAESMRLNGHIWGNVRVTSLLALEEGAVIVGQVTAERLAMEEGAVIQGEVLIGKKMLPPKRPASSGEDSSRS